MQYLCPCCRKILKELLVRGCSFLAKFLTYSLVLYPKLNLLNGVPEYLRYTDVSLSAPLSSIYSEILWALNPP